MRAGALVAAGAVLAILRCGSGTGAGKAPLAPGGTGGGVAPQPSVALTVVADGFPLLTDVQPVPGQPSVLAVSVNGGTISWVSMDDGSRGEIRKPPVQGELPPD